MSTVDSQLGAARPLETAELVIAMCQKAARRKLRRIGVKRLSVEGQPRGAFRGFSGTPQRATCIRSGRPASGLSRLKPGG